jgi:hypothetical protein
MKEKKRAAAKKSTIVAAQTQPPTKVWMLQPEYRP